MFLSISVFVLMIIVLLLLAILSIFLYRYARDEMFEVSRINRNFLFLWDWMYKKRIYPTKIKDKLDEYGIGRVVIYGAGFIGVQLYYELKQFGIEVVCFIDNNKTEIGIDNIPVVSLKNDYPRADAAIIALSKGYESIEKALKPYYKIVFMLDELI